MQRQNRGLCRLCERTRSLEISHIVGKCQRQKVTWVTALRGHLGGRASSQNVQDRGSVDPSSSVRNGDTRKKSEFRVRAKNRAGATQAEVSNNAVGVWSSKCVVVSGCARWRGRSALAYRWYSDGSGVRTVSDSIASTGAAKRHRGHAQATAPCPA